MRAVGGKFKMIIRAGLPEHDAVEAFVIMKFSETN
jgi:hypothetical protein